MRAYPLTMLQSAARARLALSEARWDDARSEAEAILQHDRENAEAQEILGTALFWLDSPEQSFEVRSSAYRLLLDRGDPRGAARVAMCIALDVADYHGMAVASGWLQRARTLLSGVDRAPEHGWLALWEGHFIRALEHDLDRARAAAREASAIARQFGISPLELLAGALEGLVDVTAGNVRDGMRRLDEATAAAVAGEITDIDAVVVTCCFLVHACERVCDWERGAQWSARLDTMSQRWRLGNTFAGCRAEHAALLIGRGEWERAERELLSAIESLQTTRPVMMTAAVVQLADLRRRQGRIEEACELYGRFPGVSESILGLSAIALERGDAVRAADQLARLRRKPLAEKWVERAVLRELLVRSSLALGQRSEAGAAAEELHDLASQLDIPIVGALSHLARGHLAAAEDPVRARECYEDAIDLFERCPAPWEAARARMLLAAVLRQIGREAFAREELEAARSAFRRLGADADESRAAALLGNIVPRHRDTPLTKRELEVLRMVARGLSDKEVASTLGLSEHTVHRHVSNILGKLGMPTRTAAVAAATGEGWI